LSADLTSPPEIFVRTAIRHPRLRYVLSILDDDLGYRFRFYNDRSVFPRSAPPFLVDYGGAGPRSWPAHPLLSGKNLPPASPPSLSPDGLPDLFPTPEGPDLLAAIFYLLSRMEEYADFMPDAHGRFPASQSHGFRHGYLRRPVVREWTAVLGRQLLSWFPTLPAPRHPDFRFAPTYDIDMLWAYHYRGWRGPASALRQLLRGEYRGFRRRLTATPLTDPFFTLPQLMKLHDEKQVTANYFWLVSNSSDRRDPNPFPVPLLQRKWMQRLGQRGVVAGLHPSYHSMLSGDRIREEKERLVKLAGGPVNHSRQHFLRFRLPDTYRGLLAAGITHDHSMGYADRSGWRAGTNLPFAWYDLEREEVTKLIVHPFAAMDVTLRQYEGLSGADAGASIRELAESIRPFGGPFALLWHNSSFSEDHGWAGWWEMYREVVGELAATSGEIDR
jgi:hypothetical protein